MRYRHIASIALVSLAAFSSVTRIEAASERPLRPQPLEHAIVGGNASVGIFGGRLLLPSGIQLDASSLLKGDVRLSNLQGHRVDGTDRSRFVIRIGPIDAAVVERFEAGAEHYSCYGFQQRVQEVKTMEGTPLFMALFFDDSLFVTVTSDDSELWTEMLTDFAVRDDDPELMCFSEE